MQRSRGSSRRRRLGSVTTTRGSAVRYLRKYNESVDVERVGSLSVCLTRPSVCSGRPSAAEWDAGLAEHHAGLGRPGAEIAARTRVPPGCRTLTRCRRALTRWDRRPEGRLDATSGCSVSRRRRHRSKWSRINHQQATRHDRGGPDEADGMRRATRARADGRGPRIRVGYTAAVPGSGQRHGSNDAARES